VNLSPDSPAVTPGDSLSLQEHFHRAEHRVVVQAGRW